jgi:hypothetical protein
MAGAAEGKEQGEREVEKGSFFDAVAYDLLDI